MEKTSITTLEQCRDNDIAVFCKNTAELNDLYREYSKIAYKREATGELLKHENSSYKVYFTGMGSLNFTWNYNRTNSKSAFPKKHSDVIDYSQILKNREFPKSWAILGGQDFVKFLMRAKESGVLKTTWNGDSDDEYYSCSNGIVTKRSTKLPEGYIKVTLTQLENHYFFVEKEFPEKWAIKPDKEVMDKIKEMLIPLKYTFFGSNPTSYYWHYPLTPSTGSGFGCIQPGYTEITVEQFKEQFMKEKNMKQTGWKLKEEYASFERAAAIIAYGTNGAKKIGSDILVGSGNERRLVDADVIVWFEPVYKEEFKLGDWVVVVEGGNGASGCNGEIGQITDKSITNGNYSEIKISFPNGKVWGLNATKYELRKATEKEIETSHEVELLLGSNKIEIKISKARIEAEGFNINVNALSKLVNDMDGSNYYDLPWKTYTDKVKIGCSTFTRSELLQILQTYDRINSTSYSVEGI